MAVLSSYIINNDSMVIFPEYDEFGNLYSKLIEEKGNIFIVKKKPVSLIDSSIRHYGSSLKGGVEGARHTLGNINVPPFLVCSRRGLIWFSTVSHKREDCIFISFRHIVDILQSKRNPDECIVIFKHGHSAVLNEPHEVITRKYDLANRLHRFIGQREGIRYFYSMESSRSGYQFIKERNERNYKTRPRRGKAE